MSQFLREIGIDKFLDEYRQMRLKPLRNNVTEIEGPFPFAAQATNFGQIEDTYDLRIAVTLDFPRAIPEVEETSNKIPRNGNYHVNPGGSLCLGSPLRLLRLIAQEPTLLGFAQNCVIPYLYSVSYALRNNGTFPFGDLRHGSPGVIEDYLNLFDLRRPRQVLDVLRLLGMRKSRANKRPCPCGCGKRLGGCRLVQKVNEFRKIGSRPWYRVQLTDIEQELAQRGSIK